MAVLNTATSIVDFLKSRGFKPQVGDRFPLFQERKQIYENLGLKSQLGEFRGSGEQNIALLKKLSEAEKLASVRINPSNVFDVLKISKPTTPQTQQFQPLQPLQQPTQTKELSITPSFNQQPASITPNFLPEQKQNNQTTTFQLDKETLNRLFGQPLSEQEIAQMALEKVTGSATFPLLKERQQSEKERLMLEQQQKTEEFIKNIASRGLIFSGAKTKGVNQIEADTLANLLNVDRKFALLIAQGLESAAQQIAKEATRGNQAALESLRSLGFDVNPITGKIEPTLAAQKAATAEEQFAQREARLLETQKTLEEARSRSLDLREIQLGLQAQNQALLNQYRAALLDLRAKGLESSAASRAILDEMRRIQLEDRIAASPFQVVNAKTNRPINLTSEEGLFLSQAVYLKDLANEVKALIKKAGTNAIKGFVTEAGKFVPIVQDKLDPLQQELLIKMYDMNNLFVYFSTGKQLNAQEFERLSNQLPNIRGTTERNLQTIDNFTRSIESRFNNYLKLNGWKILQPNEIKNTTQQVQPTQVQPTQADIDYVQQLKKQGLIK